MANTGVSDPIQTTFDLAVEEFKQSLKDDKIYKEILKTKSITDVYDATDKLQKEQGRAGHLRHLSKIEPFLKGMQEYTGVIEQFLQVKPDVIALIWGPIKLLLQWASALKKTFDDVINVTAEIGRALPEFQQMVTLFGQNSHIKEVLRLFYTDILEFYAITLKFFSSSRLRYLAESLWPAQRERINLVIGHIKRDALLVRNGIRLEHIQQEYEARTRAIQHYELVEKQLRRQEYNAIKTEISPMDFGKELYRLKGLTHPGTGDWLVKHTIFKKWLSSADPTASVLWQYGIPGAGKTFLACEAVYSARKKSHTAFAFLSYREAKTITALSVILSLMFQLAAQDEQLQDVIRQTKPAELQSDLDTAREVFVKLIMCLGTVFIVLDGVDEIQPHESDRLIITLLKVPDEAKGTRLLISSRPEDLISKKLKGRAQIRVDENNLESIKIFVAQRSDDWLGTFFPDAKKEIRALLAPLADKSKGMFLYASLVLESIKLLSDVDEIKADLATLPEELADLYERIVGRIKKLPPIARNKALKILGWVAITPKPLTLQELEQALIITPGDVATAKLVTRSLNVVELCGPIIEVSDEYVVLVHFTVTEYLLKRSIKEEEATLRLAQCCVTYLSQQHHDIDRSNMDIDQAIVSGTYRLHQFAATTWLELTRRYLQLCSTDPSTEFVDQLYSLREARDSSNLDTKPSLSPSSFRCLKHSDPDLHDWLCAVYRSRREFLELDLRNLQGHQYSDPTTLPDILKRIYTRLNGLLRESTSQRDSQFDTIKQHFGLRTFRCAIVGCYHYRHGFESEQFRADHLTSHAFKCKHADCELNPQEFTTRKAFERHLELFHPQQPAPLLLDKPLNASTEDDARELIFELIALNHTSGVRNLLKQQADDFDLFPITSREQTLRESDSTKIEIFGVQEKRAVLAATSCDVLTALLDWAHAPSGIYKSRDKRLFTMLLRSAVFSNNFSVFKFLVRHENYASLQDRGLDVAILTFLLEHDRPEFTAEIKLLMEESLIKFEFEKIRKTKLIVHLRSETRRQTRSGSYLDEILKPWGGELLVNQASKSEHKARILVSWWRALDLFASEDQCCLELLAYYYAVYCQEEFMEYLISRGACIHRCTFFDSPLYRVCHLNTKQSALFTVYLLEHGASLDFHPMSTSSSALKYRHGPKNIRKRIGKGWEDLIKSTESTRKSLQEPEGVQNIRLQTAWSALIDELLQEVRGSDWAARKSPADNYGSLFLELPEVEKWLEELRTRGYPERPIGQARATVWLVTIIGYLAQSHGHPSHFNSLIQLEDFYRMAQPKREQSSNRPAENDEK